MEINNLIHKVFISENPVKIFLENIEKLKEVTFFFFDNNANPIPELKEKNFGDFRIQGLGKYNNMFILNEKILQVPISELKIKKIIHFDSNIITLLGDFFFDKEKFKKKYVGRYTDFIKILDYIRNNDMIPNCEPYLIERTLNDFPIVDNIKNEIYRNILAFVLFCSKNYNTLRESKYSLDIKEVEDNLKIEADKKFNYILNNKIKSEEKNKHYFAIYSLLLKSYIIAEEYSLKEKRKKKFVEFILEEFGLYLEKEIILCLLYLENKLEKYNLKNFFKLKKSEKSSELENIEQIKNTAWDLFHTRYMEQKMAEEIKKNEYTVNFFFTYDKKLNNYIDFNYAKRMAFYKNHSYVYYLKNLEIDNFENYKKLFDQKEKIEIKDMDLYSYYKNLSQNLEIKIKKNKE